MSTARRKPATVRAEVFDPRALAEAQVAEYVGDADVSDRKRSLAVDRHAAVLAAAGRPVDLDWYTRQFVHPARGAVSP